MPLIAESRFDDIASVPFSYPETELQPNSCIQLASIYVPLGRNLRARWLSLHVPRLTASSDIMERVNVFREAVYVGLYAGNFDRMNQIGGIPVMIVGVDGTGYAAANGDLHYDFSAPGHYGLMLVNNTREHVFTAVVTGGFRLF